MKTNSVISRVFSIIFCLSFCISFPATAQNSVPKNYFGVSGVGELNRLAVGVGAEYERWIHVKGPVAVGGKLNHIFASKTFNFLFSSDDLLQKVGQTQLMATSYFFTGKSKTTQGFFLSFGLGANLIKWSKEVPDGSGNYQMVSRSEIAPGFDISLGSQFVITDHFAVRLTGGYQAFPADKYNEFVTGNGISLLYVKVSIGF